MEASFLRHPKKNDLELWLKEQPPASPPLPLLLLLPQGRGEVWPRPLSQPTPVPPPRGRRSPWGTVWEGEAGYGDVSCPAGGWCPYLHPTPPPQICDPSSPIEGLCLDIPPTQADGVAQKEALPTQTLIRKLLILVF